MSIKKIKMNKTKGQLFVIAAASGVGKTTLVNEILHRINDISLSVSHTSRPRRSKEIDGVHYNFVKKEEFEQMIAHGDFIEHANVYDNFYGTSKKWLEKVLNSGQDIILELDWQGNLQIRNLYPEAVSIFILPPSLDDLRKRLESRAEDKKDIIEKRLHQACQDISHYVDFDYLVVNDDFERAVADIEAVINATRLKLDSQRIKLGEMLKTLLA